MEHIPTRATTKGPADWSSGDVYVDPITEGQGPAPMGVGSVHFTPLRPHGLAPPHHRPDPLVPTLRQRLLRCGVTPSRRSRTRRFAAIPVVRIGPAGHAARGMKWLPSSRCHRRNVKGVVAWGRLAPGEPTVSPRGGPADGRGKHARRARQSNGGTSAEGYGAVEPVSSVVAVRTSSGRCTGASLSLGQVRLGCGLPGPVGDRVVLAAVSEAFVEGVDDDVVVGVGAGDGRRAGSRSGHRRRGFRRGRSSRSTSPCRTGRAVDERCRGAQASSPPSASSDHVAGDLPELAVLGLGTGDEQVEGVVGADPVGRHEDSLGLLDHGSGLHRLAQVARQFERRPIGLGVGHDDRRLRRERLAQLLVVVAEPGGDGAVDVEPTPRCLPGPG